MVTEAFQVQSFILYNIYIRIYIYIYYIIWILYITYYILHIIYIIILYIYYYITYILLYYIYIIIIILYIYIFHILYMYIFNYIGYIIYIYIYNIYTITSPFFTHHWLIQVWVRSRAPHRFAAPQSAHLGMAGCPWGKREPDGPWTVGTTVLAL